MPMHGISKFCLEKNNTNYHSWIFKLTFHNLFCDGLAYVAMYSRGNRQTQDECVRLEKTFSFHSAHASIMVLYAAPFITNAWLYRLKLYGLTVLHEKVGGVILKHTGGLNCSTKFCLLALLTYFC